MMIISWFNLIYYLLPIIFSQKFCIHISYIYIIRFNSIISLNQSMQWWSANVARYLFFSLLKTLNSLCFISVSFNYNIDRVICCYHQFNSINISWFWRPTSFSILHHSISSVDLNYKVRTNGMWFWAFY